jgi:hypothetical protein
MTTLHIDGLDFHFPDGWLASKYDEWSFYRNHFVKIDNGIKAVDALAVSTGNDVFLIEVKDYRHPETTKPSELPRALADKVLHTLAAMLPARLNANDPKEQQLAAAILACHTFSVVLHIEQSATRKQIVDLADLKQKIRPLLKAIDRRFKIVSMSNMQGLAWTVK